MHLLDLGPYVLLVIFKHLSPRGKANVAQTCKQLRDIIYLKTNWRNVCAKLKFSLPLAKNQHKFNPLKSTKGESWPACLLESLYKRGISNVALLTANKRHTKTLMKLLQKHLPNLERISFGSNFFDTETEALSCLSNFYFPKLATLGFNDCSVVCGDVLDKVLISIPQLTRLYLVHCKNVNDSCVPALLQLTQLEVLHLEGTFITERGITKLAGYRHGNSWCESRPYLSKLKVLNISDCRCVSICSLVYLKRLGSLNTLLASGLISCSQSKFCLEHVGNLKSLKCLSVTYCEVNRYIEDFSQHASHLQCLHLTDLSIGDFTAPVQMSEFSSLVCLSLHWSNITDEVMEALCQSMPRLLMLDLSHCFMITDASLRCIVETLKKLLVLSVTFCSRITSVGLKLIPLQYHQDSKIYTAKDFFRNKDFINLTADSQSKEWIMNIKSNLNFLSSIF